VRWSFVGMDACGEGGRRKAEVGCDWVRRRKNVVRDGLESMVDIITFIPLFTLTLGQRGL